MALVDSAAQYRFFLAESIPETVEKLKNIGKNPRFLAIKSKEVIHGGGEFVRLLAAKSRHRCVPGIFPAPLLQRKNVALEAYMWKKILIENS